MEQLAFNPIWALVSIVTVAIGCWEASGSCGSLAVSSALSLELQGRIRSADRL